MCGQKEDPAFCLIFTLNLEVPSNEVSISGKLLAHIFVCCGICPQFTIPYIARFYI
jgi:hypothetical protein